MHTNDDANGSHDATELELKLLLDTESDAERLRAWLEANAGPADCREQVNTYFDTADLQLRAAQAMVRVRVDGVGVRATLKQKPRLRDGLMQVREVEAPVSAPLADRFRQAAPARLQSVDLPFAAAIDALLGEAPGAANPGWALHGLGALANRRLRYHVPNAAFVRGDMVPPEHGERLRTVLFELDRSLGPAGEPRYELEVEDPDVTALRPSIEALLDTLEVSFRPADMSKYAWFLQGLAQGSQWSDDATEG
jgi:uncharacterized protein YjbK